MRTAFRAGQRFFFIAAVLLLFSFGALFMVLSGQSALYAASSLTESPNGVRAEFLRFTPAVLLLLFPLSLLAQAIVLVAGFRRSAVWGTAVHGVWTGVHLLFFWLVPPQSYAVSLYLLNRFLSVAGWAVRLFPLYAVFLFLSFLFRVPAVRGDENQADKIC